MCVYPPPSHTRIPYSPSRRYAYASMLVTLRRWHAARAVLCPRSAQLWMEWALMEAAQGHAEEARRLFQKVLGEQGGNGGEAVVKGGMLGRLGRGMGTGAEAVACSIVQSRAEQPCGACWDRQPGSGGRRLFAVGDKGLTRPS